MSIAFMLSGETNYVIEEIIWEMPVQMVGRLLALSYSKCTGKKVMSRRDRKVLRYRIEKLEAKLCPTN